MIEEKLKSLAEKYNLSEAIFLELEAGDTPEEIADRYDLI